MILQKSFFAIHKGTREHWFWILLLFKEASESLTKVFWNCPKSVLKIKLSLKLSWISTESEQNFSEIVLNQYWKLVQFLWNCPESVLKINKISLKLSRISTEIKISLKFTWISTENQTFSEIFLNQYWKSNFLWNFSESVLKIKATLKLFWISTDVLWALSTIGPFFFGSQPPLNNRRMDLIMRAFAKLDSDKSGQVTKEDLEGVYDVTKHPKYMSGEWSADKIFEEFLKTFESAETTDGIVSWICCFIWSKVQLAIVAQLFKKRVNYDGGQASR